MASFPGQKGTGPPNTIPIIITPSPLPNAAINSPYSTTLAANLGTPPYTWAIQSDVPNTGNWLGINAATGVLSGTPGTLESESLVIVVTDSVGTPSAPTNFSLTVAAVLPPAAMWPGVVTSTKTLVSWWPPTGTNAETDTNTYNLYATDTPTALFRGIPARGFAGSTRHFYYHFSPDTTPSTSRTFFVTTSPPGGGAESAPGPQLTMTTLAGSATPPSAPAAVADPSTWIQAFSLPPVGNGLGTLWTPNSGGNSSGSAGFNGKLAVNCGLQFAFTFASPGDIIQLTAGVTYTPPTAAGYTMPAYAGPGWVYVISSQDPVLTPGGTLPPFEFNTNVFPQGLTLAAAPAVGATSAPLTVAWAKKTGIYPVKFSNGERRLTLFTQNSTNIDWSQHNPNGWQGTTGAGLVATGIALTASISVRYIPGPTLFDVPSLPIIQFGGPGTNGIILTTPQNLKNVRFVGVWFRATPIAAGALPFDNFFGVEMDNLGDDSVYFDRCMFGDDTSKIVSSGQPNYTFSNGNWGAIHHAIGNVHGSHLLVHQCYFQGINGPVGGGDSNGINILGGGPFAIRNCYFEVASESVIAGGSFVFQNNVPHDLTYSYNISNKLQWWQWGQQTLVFNGPNTFNFTGTGAQTVFSFGTTLNQSAPYRYMVTIAGVYQGSGYTIQTVSPSTITFAIAPANGAAIVVKSNIQFYFGDTVKNLFENKCMLRGNYHHNTHECNWYSLQSGQRGLAFNFGCRDQQSSGTADPNNPNYIPITQTCPWVVLQDIDCHDNFADDVGQFSLIFSAADFCPSAYTARIRLQNNLCRTHDDIVHGANLFALLPNGTLADYIEDHNTWILDNTNGFNANNQTTGTYFSAGTYDRIQITNCIMDAAHAIGGDNSFNLLNSTLTNLVWNNNLTIQDAAIVTPTGTTTYKGVPYASIGFTNFVDQFHSPLQPQDWNVTGATIYATGSTTGGPIGSIFGGLLSATVGVAYSQQLPLGVPPYTSPTITPNWLNQFSISSAGLVTGTPLNDEIETIVITDSTSTQFTFTLTVNPQ